MVQFLTIIFFLGFLQILLGFSNVPFFFVSPCTLQKFNTYGGGELPYRAAAQRASAPKTRMRVTPTWFTCGQSWGHAVYPALFLILSFVLLICRQLSIWNCYKPFFSLLCICQLLCFCRLALTLQPWKWTFKQYHIIYVKCEYFTKQKM